MKLVVAQPVKSASLDVVVIRKDGTREALGTVAYFHQRRICRWLFSLEQRLRTLRQSWEK